VTRDKGVKAVNKKYEEIYRENVKYVYNIALGMLRNKDDAEDVAQNVFVKLYETFSSFRGESSIKTYLYRMTINRSIDLIRKNKTAEKYAEKTLAPEKPPVPDGFILWDLLSKLDLEHRAPLLLSEIGGFSYAEISGILNVNIGTVKSRINRAINKLKSYVK